MPSRFQNSASQAICVALISFADVRTPDYYRIAVKARFPKATAKNEQELIKYGAGLVARDLQKADTVMDARLNEYLAAQVAGTEIQLPPIDVDWAKLMHDEEYRINIKSHLNAGNDPLVDDAIAYAFKARNGVIQLARAINTRYQQEAQLTAQKRKK